MKLGIALLAVLLDTTTALAQQAPAPSPAQSDAKTARIEGTVVSTTGAPISRAQLRLTAPTTQQGTIAVRGAEYSAISGDDGKFVIEAIVPGPNFQLTALKAGFLTKRYGARSSTGPVPALSLSAGETRSGVVIAMPPQAVISGRITDPNNEPQQGVQIMLLQRRYQRGVRQLSVANTAFTDDRGEFRMANVSQGRFYLQATLQRRAIIARDAGEGVRTAPIPTYYPNSADPQGAGPLDITAGQELRGIEIRIREGRVFTASGINLEANGAPLVNGQVFIMPRGADFNSAPLEELLLRPQTQPDGTFVHRDLTPGVYLVFLPSGRFTNYAGEFSIVDKDVTGLTFHAAVNGTITGSVSLDGGDLKALLPPSQDPGPARWSIGLSSTTSGPFGGGATAQMKQDGTFALENAGPGVYYLTTTLPAGIYVKSVRYGGADVTHSTVNVTSGGGTMEVLIAKNAANVNGTVQNAKGDAQPATFVTLWTDEADLGSVNKGVNIATTDPNGTFSFKDLRPGTYYAAAWEDIDAGIAQARDFLTLVTGATRIELKEGSTASPQLKLVPAATIKAAEEKLP